MYLKSIELSGFKSFAKKSILEFKKPITAIVGPNGSGKSNITEAFRFALGEQSIKSMRGQKGEDLIWNGSQEISRSSRASVRIIFDNRKKFLDLDFDEASIERAVFRDGVNEYSLNGSQVRLKDIVELLSPTHIGPSGHHIISQGEADKILNTNIRERRVMIEDALGLRIYQYKKQESEKKLIKTRENIERTKSLQRELSPHIKFLKRQYEKLLKTKELRSDLSRIFAEYFVAEKRYLETEKKKIEDEKNIPEGKLQEIQKNLAKATASLKEEKKDEKKSRLLELESKLGQLRNEKDLLTRNLGRVEGQIISLQNIFKVKKSVPEKSLTLERVEVERLRDEAQNFAEVAQKSQDLDFIKDLFRRIIQNISNLLGKEEAEDMEKSYETDELENLRDEKGILETKMKDILERQNEISESFKKLQGEIDRESDVNRELEKSVFRMRAEESELRAKLSSLSDYFQRIQIEEQNFDSDTREAKALIGEAKLDSILKDLSEDNIVNIDRLTSRKEIERLKIRLEDSGSIGEEVEKEYKEISERSTFLEGELSDLEKSADSLKKLIGDLETELSVNFESGIVKINQEFNSLFSLMFNGGSASLFLVKEKRRRKRDYNLSESELEADMPEDFSMDLSEEEEEAEEGIDIKISLPRKKIKSLEMLSGGERALTSIALIFAVSQVNPPPFLVLDETDAALDEANSRRYGDMLESLAKNSQLIIITHNRETMSRAGILYGITMGREGYSRVLSVAFEEAVTVAKS